MDIATGSSRLDGVIAHLAPPLPTSPATGEVSAGEFGSTVPRTQNGTLPLAGRVGVGGAPYSNGSADFLPLHIPLRGSFIHMGPR